MRKLFAVLLLVALFCFPSHAAMPDRDIVIIYTNDVHCGVDENIGYAGVAFYRDEMKKTNPYVTLVDAGDAVQGAVFGTISNGRYIIEIMNAMGYDLAIPGNHEFDYGMSQFENFAKNLKCGYISCNFRDDVTGQLLLEPYRMFTYGNTKVAFVGASTPDSITSSTPSSFMDALGDYIYSFDGDKTGEKLCASIQKAIDAARDAGADFVILVGHLGEYEDVTEVWSAPFVVGHTRGIDAVIDGHSHEVTPSLMIKNLDGKEIPITQTGTKLKNIGQITIDTSGKISTKLIDSVSGRNGKIDALIKELKARYEDTLKTRLGHLDFDMPALNEKNEWLIRNDEKGICDFLADAFLAASEGSAEVAFVNAGGIRADLKKGEITYNDALTVCPFGNSLCICEVSGQAILDELEMGTRMMPQRNGGLLHVAGLTYTVDISIPSPVRLDEKNMLTGVSGPRRVKDVKIGDTPLDPKKTYSVISSTYVLREKGDGHCFNGARLVRTGFVIDTDALAHYIKSFETIPDKYKTSQKRMTVIGE
ncbi:MAG: bifunctional metallophosphatase/5'-nucleotidase [Fretibacterium sp.]|nr:bifunctional metallophosphatase/5'-nucleotidase [Fretibacterium sp.]